MSGAVVLSISLYSRLTCISFHSSILAAGVGDAQLVVDWATPADTGVYLCHATNEVSTSVSPARTVLVVPQAPSRPTTSLDGWYSWEDDIEEDGAVWTGTAWAVMGGVGVLDCRVRASPQPSFQWTDADGLPIITGDKYLIHFPQLVDDVVEWSSVLEVKDITQEDFDNFTCTTTNSLGSLDFPLSLNRHSRPGAAPLVLNVTVVSDSGVIVTWNDVTEGPAPAGYTIRLRSDQHPQYQLVDVPGTNTSSWEVKGLSTGAKYSFTVQSYNQKGRPYHTSPAIEVLMKADYEMDEETSDEAKKTDDEQVIKRPQGISLFMFVLIALTGAVLFVLNITGVLCYLRRRSFFQGLSDGSSRKDSAYEVPSPSLVDHLSLSSTDDIPPPDYEQVMGTLGRVSFGGSLVDVRRASGSRGTPSLARSSPIVTSSSTISAGLDLDIDEIIAPPDDFSNELNSMPSDEIMSGCHGRNSWADLDNMSSSEQLVPHSSGRDLPISHHSRTSYTSSTFHHSLESLDQLYSLTQETRQPLTLPRPPSHIIYHGPPHFQHLLQHQQHEHMHQITQGSQQQQQQQQHMIVQQCPQYHFPMPLDSSQAFGYPKHLTQEQYYFQQQSHYQPHTSESSEPMSPSYASLDPSMLYAQHSTFFTDGSQSLSAFPEQQSEGSPPVQATVRFSLS